MNPLASDLNHVLAHTEGLWDELRGQRIFITGGTGFFGCWLLESFAWANDKLGLKASALVLSRNPEAFKAKAPHLAGHPAIQFHKGDICSFEFPKGRFSHVIHAATEASAKLNEESPLVMFDAIVGGTRRTLDFARQSGARKFLLASSGAVYGRQPSQLTHVGEDYTGAPNSLDPASAYHEGKRAAELLCAMYAKVFAIEAKIARCFAFVGPHLPLDAHFAIGNFIRDGLRGGPIRVKGDGTPLRSYLYAADLAVWLWTILFKGHSCRPYNVGSGEDVSIRTIADKVAAAFKNPIAIEIEKMPVEGRLPDRYVPSVARAAAELNLREAIPLSEAIRKTVEWHTEAGRGR